MQTRDGVQLSAAGIVGREADARAVVAKWASHRLVTIVGPPGVGKTSLAGAVAAPFAAEAGAQVVHIDLGGASDVLDATARAFGRALSRSPEAMAARDAWGVPAWASELAALGPLLVVLDECELVLEPVREIAELVLESSDETIVLATSRERLDLAEEAVHALGGLDASASMTLLSARSVHVDRDALATIAREVDGLPIALDICARLLETLTPGEVHARLDQLPAMRPIERILRSAWEPLDPELRSAWISAALFRGAFTLDWLEAVVDPRLRPRAVELVDTLVKKSLVVREQGERSTALRVLATVRAFVLGEAMRDEGFSEFELRFHRALLDLVSLPRSRESAALLASELALVGTSRVESTERGLEPPGGEALTLQILARVAELLRYRGQDRRVADLFGRALALASPSAAATRLRVHRANALGAQQRLSESIAESERAFADAAGQGDPALELVACHAVADAYVRIGRDESGRRALQLAESLAESLASPDRKLDHVMARVSLEWRSGTAAAAFHEAVRGLAIAKAANLPIRIAQLQILLGQTAAAECQHEVAADYFSRAWESEATGTAPSLRVLLLVSIGLERTRAGDLVEASEHLASALGIAREHGLVRWELWASAYAGLTEVLRGGSALPLEDAALRVDLDEPLLLLIPLFAAVAGSRVARSLLDEGLARAARPTHDARWIPSYVEACTAAVEHRADAMARAAARLPPAFTIDFAVCTTLLESIAARMPREAAPARLFAASDASWFRVAGMERVSLGASGSAKCLLLALIETRRDTPGRALTLDDLRTAAWPGDRSRRDAAANRVYVAIARLRSRGLRGVLASDERGWFILPEIDVTIEPAT